MFLAVRISSYGCTWEVWRALKKLELLEAIRTLIMNQFLISVSGKKLMRKKSKEDE